MLSRCQDSCFRFAVTATHISRVPHAERTDCRQHRVTHISCVTRSANILQTVKSPRSHAVLVTISFAPITRVCQLACALFILGTPSSYCADLAWLKYAAYRAGRPKNTTRSPAPCFVWWCLKFPLKRKNFSIHNICGDFAYNLSFNPL